MKFAVQFWKLCDIIAEISPFPPIEMYGDNR